MVRLHVEFCGEKNAAFDNYLSKVNMYEIKYFNKKNSAQPDTAQSPKKKKKKISNKIVTLA